MRGKAIMNGANKRPFEDFAKHMHGLPEFHYAALTGKEDLLRKMLSDDSRIFSSVDIYGRTTLHIAASHDKYSSLKLLCKHCSEDEVTLDRSDSFGYTALHYAVQGPNTYCAKLLLDSGCDVNPAQHSKCTPLHLAALYGYPELVALLCERGANVHARSSYQETPLQMATRSGIRIREKLKLRLKIKQAKKTSWWPVKEVHYTTLALLLKFGSSANVRDNEGITPLHYVAMHCEKKECAALLCAAGASITYRNQSNVTAVHIARFAEVKNFLRRLERIPPRLEHLCLLAVRLELRNDLTTKTQHLPLPKPLKDKILFKTLPRVL